MNESTSPKISDGSKNSEKQTSHSRRVWFFIIPVLSAIIIAGIFLFQHPSMGHEQELFVDIVTAEPGDVNIYGEYDGNVQNRQFVEIHARVEGYLESILFQDGAYVEKGKTLFVIDSRLYKAMANRARAQLNKAQAQERKAKRDLDRIKPLYAQNAASQLDLDNATAAYESANADVAVSEADLTQAELTLGYTRISSPISGYISKRVADIGTHVGPSGGQSLLATISNNDTVGVNFQMPAIDYLNSKRTNANDSAGTWNPTLTLILADGSEYPYKGTADYAGQQVDPKTGTYSINAAVPNPGYALMTDQPVKVRILIDVSKNAIAIPTQAIITDDGGTFAYIVRPDNTIEKRAVTTGASTGSLTVIEHGLTKGEKVAVGDNLKLTEGKTVSIRQK